MRPIEEKSTNHGAEVKTGAKCKSAPFLTGRGAGGGGGAAHLACPLGGRKRRFEVAGGENGADLPPPSSLNLILLVRTSFVLRTPGVRATKGGPRILITEK